MAFDHAYAMQQIVGIQKEGAEKTIVAFVCFHGTTFTLIIICTF